MVSFLSGWRASVLFNGVCTGRGRKAVVRAGDDHEEAVERLRGSGLLPEVLGTPAKRLIQKNIWIKILIQIKIHNQIQIQVAGVPAERQRPVLPQCPRQNLRPQLQTHSTGKISKFVLEMLEITWEYFQRCNCCIRCSTGKPVHMMSYKTFKQKPDIYLS